MIGALFGDIAGSIYEHHPIKYMNFDLFNPKCTYTDDSVLTIAIADILLHQKPVIHTLKEYTRSFPQAGYGSNFYQWAMSETQKSYNSWGNGAAMRISPVGFSGNSLTEVLQKSKLFTEVTHSHPEGIKGAQATASSIYLAKIGKSKSQIHSFITDTFHYNISIPLKKIRPKYCFDVSCQGTVPVSIRAFLESKNFEHAIQLAISMGGDSDTLACITGGIAHAFYQITPKIENFVLKNVPRDFHDIIYEFCDKYECSAK